MVMDQISNVFMWTNYMECKIIKFCYKKTKQQRTQELSGPSLRTPGERRCALSDSGCM